VRPKWKQWTSVEDDEQLMNFDVGLDHTDYGGLDAPSVDEF